jgi:hypothetical protein
MFLLYGKKRERCLFNFDKSDQKVVRERRQIRSKFQRALTEDV